MYLMNQANVEKVRKDEEFYPSVGDFPEPTQAGAGVGGACIASTAAKQQSAVRPTESQWKDNKVDSLGGGKRLCPRYPCLLSLARLKY